MSNTTIKKNRKKGLAGWLSENPDATEKMRSRVEDANQSYLRSLPGYGKTGEALSLSGLAKSGYSEYLAGLAFSDRQSRIATAKRKKESSAAKGYSAYLSAYEKNRISAEKSVLSTVLSQGIVDQNQAYDLAVSYGLGHGDAKRLAESSIRLSQAQGAKQTEELKRTVLQKMISYGFSAKDGVAYAEAYGFDNETAKTLAELAEKLYRAKRLGITSVTYDDLIHYYS